MLSLFLFFFKEMDLDDGRPKFNSDEEEEEKVWWGGIWVLAQLLELVAVEVAVMILSLSQKSEGKRKFYGLVFERKSKVFVREREEWVNFGKKMREKGV